MSTIPELIAELDATTLGELLDDDPLLETNWNQAVRCIKNLTALVKLVKEWDCPAVGGKYVRYPRVEKTVGGVTTILPEDPEPATRWPGTAWENIGTFFSGSFFRVEGGAAKDFGTGPQETAILDHRHKVSNSPGAGGGFHPRGTDYDGSAHDLAGGSGAIVEGVNGYGEITVTSENRPPNYTIQIYRRTA